MAGGPSTPALAAAVSEAGGLGFVAAGYRTAEQMASDIEEVRACTSAPVGVNLFVPGPGAADGDALAAYARELEPEASRYGTPLGPAHDDDDGWGAKLAVLRFAGVAVVSFTFGCPEAGVLEKLRGAGSEVWVTVTSPGEARVGAQAGADALVVQGIEAGGHQSTFDDRADPEGFGVLALLRVVRAVTELPLIAAGGLTDGPAVAAVLAAGAAAAQVGTALMLSPEAGTDPAQREALAGEDETALTRAFSGRRARGLRNRFMAEHGTSAPSAYPHIHHLTSPVRAEARKRGDADGFNLWAGQAHGLARAAPAGEIVRGLHRDARAALQAALAGRVGPEVGREDEPRPHAPSPEIGGPADPPAAARHHGRSPSR